MDMENLNYDDIIVVKNNSKPTIEYSEKQVYRVELSETEIIELGLGKELMDSIEDMKNGKKPKGYNPYGYLFVTKTVILPDGTKKRVKVYGKTKEELARKYDELIRKYPSPTDKSRTVREWGETWVNELKTGVTEKGRRDYAGILKNHIYPAFGDKYVQDVAKMDLQAFLNTYEGRNFAQVSKIKQTIGQLFGEAFDNDLIAKDPSLNLKMPTTYVGKRDALKPEEREILLKVAKTHPQGDFAKTCIYTGGRFAEVGALTTDKCDFVNKTILFDSAINYDRTGRPSLGETKRNNMRIAKNKPPDKSGHRKVPMPEPLVPVLIELCKGKSSDEFLFPDEKGGLASTGTRQKWTKSFFEQCQIEGGAKLNRKGNPIPGTSTFSSDITFHCLRHEYSTDLEEAHVPERTHKTFMGHILNDITDRYTHSREEAFNYGAVLLNKFYVKLGEAEAVPDTNIAVADDLTIASVEVDSQLFARLNHAALKLGHSMDNVFSVIILEFTSMYNFIRTSARMTMPLAKPLGLNTINISFRAHEESIALMEKIADEIGFSVPELYFWALESYVLNLETGKEGEYYEKI